MSKKPIQVRSRDLKNVRLLKDEHVMKLFAISRSCLYQWRKRKIIPYRKFGSTNYYIEEVILTMLFLRAGFFQDDLDKQDELDKME